LIDGRFDHVGKIKGPILRGLSARAPHFHSGSAQTLLDAVHFYKNMALAAMGTDPLSPNCICGVFKLFYLQETMLSAFY
jgi:cytochrome c peroxidase